MVDGRRVCPHADHMRRKSRALNDYAHGEQRSFINCHAREDITASIYCLDYFLLEHPQRTYIMSLLYDIYSFCLVKWPKNLSLTFSRQPGRIMDMKGRSKVVDPTMEPSHGQLLRSESGCANGFFPNPCCFPKLPKPLSEMSLHACNSASGCPTAQWPL